MLEDEPAPRCDVRIRYARDGKEVTVDRRTLRAFNDTPEPKRCETCGSDDPRYFITQGPARMRLLHRNDNLACLDDFHNPAPDQPTSEGCGDPDCVEYARGYNDGVLAEADGAEAATPPDTGQRLIPNAEVLAEDLTDPEFRKAWEANPQEGEPDWAKHLDPDEIRAHAFHRLRERAERAEARRDTALNDCAKYQGMFREQRERAERAERERDEIHKMHARQRSTVDAAERARSKAQAEAERLREAIGEIRAIAALNLGDANERLEAILRDAREALSNDEGNTDD